MENSKYIGVDDTAYDLASTMFELLEAWKAFKSGHDLESEKLKCCDVSQKLFDALNRWEEVAAQINQTEN